MTGAETVVTAVLFILGAIVFVAIWYANEATAHKHRARTLERVATGCARHSAVRPRILAAMRSDMSTTPRQNERPPEQFVGMDVGIASALAVLIARFKP